MINIKSLLEMVESSLARFVPARARKSCISAWLRIACVSTTLACKNVESLFPKMSNDGHPLSDSPSPSPESAPTCVRQAWLTMAGALKQHKLLRRYLSAS